MNLSEPEILLEVFKTKFEKRKKTPIVLYGIGKNTKYILENLEGYNIVGLMDPIKTGTVVYGLPVLTKDEANDCAKVIVIIARRTAIRSIYDRIKEISSENLEITNLLGVDFNCKSSIKEEIATNPYWENNKEDLLKRIENYDAISFDIFDTLISRYVFKAENIFDIVENILNEKRIIANFKIIRIEAQEKAELVFGEPTFDEVYMCFSESTSLPKSLIEYIKNLEFEIEKKCVYPRKDMLQVLIYTLEKNKIVYLISDMYFSKKQIRILLNTCGIDYEIPILVSSEYRKSKEDGSLYSMYKDMIGDKKCLHLGDNYEVDILNANKYKIDGYHVKSGYSLAMESGLYSIVKNSFSLDNGIILGLLAAKLFSSPFALSKSKGRIEIKNGYIFGYIFCGTMMLNFLTFLIRETAEDKDGIILFGSRDGYFIRKLYELVTDKLNLKNVPQNTYFLTSRRAATVAACCNVDDIERILKKSSMQCTLEELIEIKFGITPKVTKDNNILISTTSDYETARSYLLQNKDEILVNAELERRNYLKYMEEIGCLKYKKLWFYDFVTTGTIINALNSFVKKKVDLICFAASGELSNECQKEFEIKSFLGDHNLNLTGSKNIEYYLIWECILTSPDSQIVKFDENGKPIYQQNRLEGNNFENFEEIQKGIKDFILEFLEIKQKLPETDFDRRLSEEIFGFIKSEFVEIGEELKNKFEFENNYENIKRESIWDLII